jgi:hypothetical protein
MIALVACSSSSSDTSGVAENKLLVSLTASERSQLCSFRTSVESAPRSVTCPDQSTVMVQGQASCVTAFSNVEPECVATVADAEACFHAFNSDPCGHGDGGCTTLFTCVLPTD